MGRRTHLPFDESARLNNATYNDYFIRLKNLSLSAIEWFDLPNNMTSRYVESILFDNGKAALFQDPVTNALMIWKVSEDGRKNWRGESTSYFLNAFNGDQIRLPNSECVILRNNFLQTPTKLSIDLFAHRLYKIKRTIDVNVDVQKTPYLVSTTKKTELSVRNALMKIDGYETSVIGIKDFLSNNGVDKIKVLPTEAPYVADKLTNLEHVVWNDALTFLGINNANTDKKERLIVDEVNANNDFVSQSAEVMLASRKEFCEDVNSKYGTNISVKLRKEAVVNVNLHDNDTMASGGEF